jgi:hypothetical protein
MLSCIDSLQIETDLLLEMQRRKFGMNVLGATVESWGHLISLMKSDDCCLILRRKSEAFWVIIF